MIYKPISFRYRPYHCSWQQLDPASERFIEVVPGSLMERSTFYRNNKVYRTLN